MQTRRVSVTGALIRDGLVLIVRRSEREEFLAGYYELPGGQVEFGDDPARSIEREFLEETGLSVRALKPYHVLSYVLPADTHRFDIVYIVHTDERSDVVLSEEHDAYRWVSETELDELIATGAILMTEEMHAIINEGFAQSTSSTTRGAKEGSAPARPGDDR